MLRDSFMRLPPGLPRRQHHASMKALVLLLLAAATADDDVSGSSRLGGTAAIGGGTTTFLVTRPAQNVSAATAAIDRWFQFHQNNESYAPKAWTVAKPDDVPRPWHEIGASSKSKTVYRATVKGKSVIVKGRKMRKEWMDGDARHGGGGVLYLEMVYLEAPAADRASPSCWARGWDGPHVVLVVADGGEAIGEGPPGVGTAPNVMTAAFDARALKPAAGAGEVHPGVLRLLGFGFLAGRPQSPTVHDGCTWHGLHGRRPEGRAGPAPRAGHLARLGHEGSRREG